MILEYAESASWGTRAPIHREQSPAHLKRCQRALKIGQCGIPSEYGVALFRCERDVVVSGNDDLVSVWSGVEPC